MIDETKAAKPGSAQPASWKRSGWMKSRPLKAWSRSTGPYMCTPQPLQAWRRISALGSTTASLSPFSSTVTFSWAVTATTENLAPSGFQHLVQPQAWLWATCPLIATFTGRSAQAQTSVPPLKLALPGLTPPSSAGCIDTEAMTCSSQLWRPPGRRQTLCGRTLFGWSHTIHVAEAFVHIRRSDPVGQLWHETGLRPNLPARRRLLGLAHVQTSKNPASNGGAWVRSDGTIRTGSSSRV
ncbi:protein of unknown function [Aminobacter niigataensis]|nr:protein of unknown function [Aminobacter niigataensis]